MAAKVTKVSDIDGTEGADYGVVIRSYPGVDGAKLLDVTPDQAKALSAAAVKDVLSVEIRNPDTSTTAVLVSKAELDKWMGKSEVVKNAASLRGRRPGYSPTNGNGH